MAYGLRTTALANTVWEATCHFQEETKQDFEQLSEPSFPRLTNYREVWGRLGFRWDNHEIKRALVSVEEQREQLPTSTANILDWGRNSYQAREIWRLCVLTAPGRLVLTRMQTRSWCLDTATNSPITRPLRGVRYHIHVIITCLQTATNARR